MTPRHIRQENALFVGIVLFVILGLFGAGLVIGAFLEKVL